MQSKCIMISTGAIRNTASTNNVLFVQVRRYCLRRSYNLYQIITYECQTILPSVYAEL